MIERAPSSQGSDTILVANSLGPIDSAVHDVSLSLLAALPILLGVVAITAWIMTGRTLSPVESIRAQVAEISTREMGRRVPVPATSDEIERLARTMNSMLDRLEEAQARETRFVADASHELRSPITAVRAQLETALAHPQDVDWPAVATTVLDEELSMERLITELLLLARSDHGTSAEQRALVDLSQLVVRELDHIPLREGLTLDVSNVSEAHMVGDSEQLARVIRNLAENALRHARKHRQRRGRGCRGERGDRCQRRRPRDPPIRVAAGIRSVHEAGRSPQPKVRWRWAWTLHRQGDHRGSPRHHRRDRRRERDAHHDPPPPPTRSTRR